jgi:glycerophosphoryl diester phosphodiesterase
VIPRNTDDTLAEPTAVVRDAHRVGLVVHPFTFRVENQFLPREFRSSTDPNAPGDLVGEIQAFLDVGIDGFFTDNPDIGVAAAATR